MEEFTVEFVTRVIPRALIGPKVEVVDATCLGVLTGDEREREREEGGKEEMGKGEWEKSERMEEEKNKGVEDKT